MVNPRIRSAGRVPGEISYRMVGLFAGAFLLLIILLMSIHVVNYGERGVLTTWGKVSPDPLPEGIYFKMPVAQNIYNMDVKVQKMQGVADSASKDLQSLDTTIALNYHIDDAEATVVYKNIGTLRMIEDKVIDPGIQEACKAGTAQFTAEELITKRPLVKETIKELLGERLSHYGIILDDFSIVNFQFSSEFDVAIEHKVTAEQNALRAQWELEKYKIEQQMQIEAAKAYADAILTRAKADANATVIRAEADAEAFRLRNAELTPILVEYLQLMQWNGVLPQFMGTQAVPFINVSN